MEIYLSPFLAVIVIGFKTVRNQLRAKEKGTYRPSRFKENRRLLRQVFKSKLGFRAIQVAIRRK